MLQTTVPVILATLVVGCTYPQEPDISQAPVPVAISAADRDSAVPQDTPEVAVLPASRTSGILIIGKGDTIHTDLRGLSLLTYFTDKLERTWAVCSGLQPGQPEGNPSLFVISPSDPASSSGATTPWHMPGQLVAAADTTAYYEAEVFAGEVLPDTVGVIWYDRSLMPDGQWRENTTLLNLNGTEPDTLVLFGHGRRSSTLNLAFHGKCRRLKDPGR